MPCRFSLTFSAEGRADVKIEGEFTDEEHQLLTLYLDNHEVLRQSRALREEMQCNYRLKWDHEAGLSVEGNLPDTDTLSGLLHLLRPFILTNEPASFNRIAGLVKRRVESGYFREAVHLQQEKYDGREQQRLVQISTNEGMLNSERMLQTWLNTHQYHHGSAADHQAMEELLSWLPGDFGRAIFISLLVDKVKAVQNLACIVALVIGRTTKLELPVPASIVGAGS